MIAPIPSFPPPPEETAEPVEEQGTTILPSQPELQLEAEAPPPGATVIAPIPLPQAEEGATTMLPQAEVLESAKAAPAQGAAVPTGFDPNKTDPALRAGPAQAPPLVPPIVPEPEPPPPPAPAAVIPPPPPKLAAVPVRRPPTPLTPPPPLPAVAPPPPPGAPTPPPVPGAPPRPPAAAPAAPEAQKRPPRPPAGRRTWLLIGGGGAALLALIVIAVVVIVSMSQPAPKPVEIPVPTPRPTAVPSPVVEEPHINPVLEAAQNALEEGDLQGARKAIAAITPDEAILFSKEESDLYDQLKEEVQGLGRDAALKDLDAGLEQGSITKLRRAIPALGDMSRREISEVRGLKEKLEQARDALRVYNLLKRAIDDRDNSAALQQAAEMTKLLPANKQSRDWREQAARAVETEADAASTSEQWKRASTDLETLRTTWPDRPGVAQRIGKLEQLQGAERKQQQALDTALARGRAGEPEGALELLAGIQPAGRFVKLYSDARAQLQAQLEKMDAQPPAAVVLNPDQLQFKKKEPARIYVRITDDYKVVSAKAMVRTEAVRTFKEMPLKKSGTDQYLLEVPPEVHGGGDIEFYIEATDRSGHVGRLGSAQTPIKVERKKWWKS